MLAFEPLVQDSALLNTTGTMYFLCKSWYLTGICLFPMHLEAFALCGINIFCVKTIFVEILAFIALISNNLCKLLCTNLVCHEFDLSILL